MISRQSNDAGHPREDEPARVPTPDAPPQFGVSGEKAERDWPLMTRDEVERVLAGYPAIGPVARLSWHSPRPFSAAVLVTTVRGEVVFVKRHHVSIRDVEGLLEEHAFIAHLRARGVPVADVLANREGVTAVTQAEWTYELHGAAPGVDAYRGAMSWTPFADVSHAYSAGRALARLHAAAADYPAPARAIRPLLSSFRVLSCADLSAALDRWVAAQPLLVSSLATRDWRADIARIIAPYHARLVPLLPALAPLWTHGDWHASNLLWTDDAPGAQVRTVLDFGLSDKTCAVYDLALAIERNAIEWLEPSETRHVHLDHVDALLDGYESLAPLSDDESAALVALLPIVHTEFALSEVAYFEGILQSRETGDVAYDGYLIGHTRWFEQPQGQALLALLERRARRPRETV